MRRLGNLSLWAVNLGAASLLLPAHHEVSTSAPIDGIAFCGAFLALDLVSYLMHRAQHSLPLLWRLHRLHHSDREVDITTALRQHPLEALLASVAFLGIASILCVPAAVVNLYTTAVFVLSLATHTRHSWPHCFERAAAHFIITLDMHRLHHGAEAAEANTNYGNIFVWWDRLFGTFSPGRIPEQFGVSLQDAPA